MPFIGREALIAQRERGLRRRWIHFKLEDPDVFLLGDEPLVFAGDIAGQATSAAFGHTLGATVGMGYVSMDGSDLAAMIETGTFAVEFAGECHPIGVSLSPFFDPSGKRMRTEP